MAEHKTICHRAVINAVQLIAARHRAAKAHVHPLKHSDKPTPTPPQGTEKEEDEEEGTKEVLATTTAAPFPLLMAPKHNSSCSRYRSDIGGTEHLSHLNKKKRSKRQEAKLAVSFTQPGNHFTLPPPPPPPSRQLPLSFNREPESQASSRGHLISTRRTLHNNTAQTKCSDKW